MQKNTRWIQSARHLLLLVALLCSSFSSMAADEETYTLNFRDADIKELIKFVADTTGYTVIMDPKIRANIQVISQEPVNRQQLYDMFLSVLSMNGFTAIKNDNVLRIVSDKTVRTQPIPVTSSGRVNAEYITRVIELENISATKLIPVLRPLMPQEGHMAAYADSNAIIVSDSRENVQKIIEIIAQLDKTTQQETEIIKLKYASAEEVVRILNQILKPQGSDKNTSEDRVNLVADTRSNSILISGGGLARMKAIVLVAKMDTALESVGNARVIYLNYANAKDLAPVLSKVSQNMARLDSGAGGTAARAATGNAGSAIEADEATNALIITAQSEVMEGLQAIIERLDVPRAQVMVEAIIVEVTQGDMKDLGVDFMFADLKGGFGGSNHTGRLGGIAQGGFNTDNEKAVTGLAGALASIPGAIWGGLDFKPNGTSFAAILTALESSGETNILSTPSLMTLDNNEASIVVGQEVPFVTGSYTSTGSGNNSNPGNPFQTINRKNVGITLKVTPHVNEGGQITLKIIQEVSGLAATEQSTVDVVTNERRIETTVNTQDGETIVLGGLIEDDVSEVVSKVPILGDMPLLGRLFKKTKTTVTKKNLMVFIRPTVVRSAENIRDVSKRQYQYMREVQKYKHARGVDLFDDDVLPILPDWEKQLEKLKRAQQEQKQNERALEQEQQPITDDNE